MTQDAADWRQFSHELRTPLNAILGNLELLLDGSAGPLSAEARACLGEIQVASRELVRQVQVFLTWSELRARATSGSDETLDLIALIRYLLATDGEEAPAIEPADASLVVGGDSTWLRTLVTEIVDLGRALPGSPGPTIRLERQLEGATLDFSWPHFRAAAPRPAQVELIVAIARLQGAAALLTEAGLRLDWPNADAGASRGQGGRGDRCAKSIGPIEGSRGSEGRD